MENTKCINPMDLSNKIAILEKNILNGGGKLLDLSHKNFAEMCAKIYEIRNNEIKLEKKALDEQKLAEQTDKMMNGIVPCKDDRCFDVQHSEHNVSEGEHSEGEHSEGEHSQRMVDRMEKEYYDLMTEAKLKETDDENFTDCETGDDYGDSFSESEDY